MRKRQRRRDGAKEAYWREQVERQVRSGLSVRAFCRERDLAENSFYAWRRELAVRDGEPTAVRTPSALQPAYSQQQPEKPRTPFTEVVVAVPAELRSVTPAIEIILTSAGSSSGTPDNRPARRIAISPGFDPATLAAVLDVLERRAC
jgi:transposase-like protein